MSDSNIPMHKRNAMGQRVGFKTGGSVGGVPLRKTGLPDTPQENARRRNGVPGMKKGGSCG